MYTKPDGSSEVLTTQYVVVTPARDEEQHILSTLDAMSHQAVRPMRWVIVDDGSSDRTASLVEEYAREHPWIMLVQRRDRGNRKNGAGVVEAFYDGYDQLESVAWEFLVKLDADVSFGPDYFECCFHEFQRDRKLGIAGGSLYNVTSSGLEFESHPTFHVRGATKIYRRSCWQQIGGIWRGSGWDTIDELKANMLGWTTRTLPEIKAFHHRKTGAAEGAWRDHVKNGRGSYVAGYHPLYLIARSLTRAHLKPYIIGSLGMMYGFAAAPFQGVCQIDDKELIQYVRKQQMNRLLRRQTVWS